MRICTIVTAFACIAVILVGCGGGGGEAVVPPDNPGMQPGEVTVGPFVMRPAAATSMQVESLPIGEYGMSAFAVFKGVTVDYIAVRELMDRIVFSSDRGTSWPLYRCDFFGDNMTQLTWNNRGNGTPAWSPDGSMIAWTYYSATSQGEILIRPEGGGAATTLTSNAADDEHPTWSPDGRWIAFHSDRTGVDRIWQMLVDGSNQTQMITSARPYEIQPDWAPDSSEILFVSEVAAHTQIFKASTDGTGQTHLVVSGTNDSYPAWHPNGDDIVYKRWVNSGLRTDIYGNDKNGSTEELLASSSGTDSEPCYSTDGDHLFFVSTREGGSESIWAKQTSFPYRLYRITNAGGEDKQPDLGGQTVQISRVLIGPSGADHGYDPIHNAAVAGVVAFNHEGYLNFVRLGIPSSSGTILTATPLENAGYQMAGVVLSGPDMYYVEEDAGVGVPPVMWDFDGGTPRTIVLYFKADDGKLVTVMDMGDSVHSASADGGAVVTQQQSGSGMIVHGDFERVYDGTGQLIAEGVAAVEIDAAGRVLRAF